MFTGIVREIGTVESVRRGRGKHAAFIRVKHLLKELGEGSSVAVQGCCLTVVRKSARGIEVDIGEETLKKTILKNLKSGDKVNLEIPLKLGDPFGGHFVQGHIDGVGSVASVRKDGGSVYLKIACPENLSPYFVSTGSVAIDGVSLTVARIERGYFEVCLIPYTLQNTTLSALRAGSKVNIEVDILGKYVLNSFATREG